MKLVRTLAILVGAIFVAVGFVHYFSVGFDRRCPSEGCVMVALGLAFVWGLVLIVRDMNRSDDRFEDSDKDDASRV